MGRKGVVLGTIIPSSKSFLGKGGGVNMYGTISKEVICAMSRLDKR